MANKLTLNDRIAAYLGLSVSHEILPIIGKNENIAIRKYLLNGQWYVNLADERTGAVRECFRKMNMVFWPVEYSEALSYLEESL